MDLNVLFAAQVAQLKRCYADLGHAPQRLQEALQVAIANEVQRTMEEVEEAQREMEGLQSHCQQYRTVMMASAGGSSKAALAPVDHRCTQGTYLARIEAWQGELQRLQAEYATRRAQVDRMIDTLEGYRDILRDFVPSIEGAAGQRDGATTDVLPIPSMDEVETALASCAEELERRTDVLQEDAQEILQLWSELAILPTNDDTMDRRLMRHLAVTPRLVDVGEGCMDFVGDFDEMPLDTTMDQQGPCDTPSRKSGSQLELSAKPSLMQPGAILPTLDNLADVHQRRQQLDEEKTRRMDTLQTLYDELIALWKRFDVADEDVDAFVQANCGCSLSVLEAYESELRQMRELKSQHMALFISKVRQDIADLWDQLMMTAEERRESFPPFFYDLADGSATEQAGQASNGARRSVGMDASDQLLALHEAKVTSLQEELATRARPLELIRQYNRLLEEAHELEESAKDTSRLTGRGAPGQKRDPGRLLREEKMRKRIKILKPKVEEELLRCLPAWEEEAGRPFVIHGTRFLDTMDLPSKQDKKRPRTISTNLTATPAATPQHGHAAKRAQLEGSVPRVVSNPQSSVSRKASAQSIQSVAQAQATPLSNRPRTVPGSSHSSLPVPASQGRSKIPSITSNATPMLPGSTAKARHGTASTTIIHSTSSSEAMEPPSILRMANGRTNSMQPPPLPTPRGAVGQPARLRNGSALAPPNMKRPSMLLEASLRHGPRPSNDFVKPTSTGAGTTLHMHGKMGANWAMLEDEDEENLLLM